VPPPSHRPLSTQLPGFEALAGSAADLVAAEQPLSPEELLSRFEQELLAARVVSFDVFDTLVVRHVNHPVDVFLHLERHPAFSHRSFPRPVAELRRTAEDSARRLLFEQHGTVEVVLPEIYRVFCSLAGLPPETADQLTAAEEAVELRLCYRNPRLVALFDRAVALRKKVIAVSDTYHRRDFLVRLLQSVGVQLPASSVFASSARRINKQSGQLFAHLLKQLALQPEEMLHVGDHRVSDGETPRRLGIRALRHGHRVWIEQEQPTPASEVGHLRSCVRSLASFEARCGPRLDNFWWLLGHNLLGPLLCGFCRWLQRGFQTDRIDRVYFLLRDGEIFHRVYRTLFPDHSGAPSLHLLHSSRRAYQLPLLDQGPEHIRRQLLVCNTPYPVALYLRRLGLNPDEFGDDFPACGFESAAAAIDARNEGTRVLALLDRPRVRAALREVVRREREALLAYFRQERLFAPGRVALVDLGWHGSLQKAVHLLARQTGTGPDALVGYYLATFQPFLENMPADLAARGFLTHLGEPADRAAVLTQFREFLEVIGSSPMGSLVCFEQTDGLVRPRCLANPAGAEQLAALGEIQAGTLAFAQNYRTVAQSLALPEIPSAVAGEELLRLLTQPTKEEVLHIGALVYAEDFGTTVARPVADFRPTSHTPADLLADFQATFWKQGMLNHPSPQGATLRTLLWLLQP
jgi:FMN phosphatase YigB (HAD superfamily)